MTEQMRTRDGHVISLSYWEGWGTSIFVRPLPTDVAMTEEERCTDIPDIENGGCGLKQDHNCGHATGVQITYGALYSEDER